MAMEMEMSPIRRKASDPRARVITPSKYREVKGASARTDPQRYFVFMAAATGDAAKLRQLLEARADPSGGDYDRRTPLHAAAAEGHLSAVQVLVEYGAHLDAVDRASQSPLDCAVDRGHQDVIDFLKSRDAHSTVAKSLESQLINSAASGNVDATKRLLELGVDANCVDYDKRTPLHLAVAEDQLETTQLLLEYKANAHAQDRWGATPYAAAKKSRPRLRAAFTAARADRDEKVFLSNFVVLCGIAEVIIIVLFAIFVDFDHFSGGKAEIPDPNEAASTLSKYPFYQDVHVMIYIGFGFLMTFLRRHGFTSLGMTFLVASITIQWYVLCAGFWKAVIHDNWQQIELNVGQLIRGDFAAGAVLITYGVLLGKISPSQLLFISLLETVFYSLNEEVSLTHRIGITDIGGSMIIHMFGAFFGLTASLVLSPKEAKDNKENSSVYHSDIFAMIGTLWLWLYWPSFNGALGSQNTQHRAVINTVLALTGSCIAAFIVSHMLRKGKFCMVDVQNATLAGGVAMGSSADLIVDPTASIVVGLVAGTFSVIGYVYIQPFLLNKIGLHDTCGVNNLHGIPSLIGGITSVVAVRRLAHDLSDSQLAYIVPRVAEGRSAEDQSLYQFIYLAITLGTAIVTGFITAVLARSSFLEPPNHKDAFTDETYWEVPEHELPYYFDHKGEPKAMAALAAEQLEERDQFKTTAEERTTEAALMSVIKELEVRLSSLEATSRRKQAAAYGLQGFASPNSVESLLRGTHS